MKVRMLEQITGTRNGVEWPAIGETVDLPTEEATQLIDSGRAEPVAEKDKPTRRRPS
jgi:hypothetical protein